MNIADATEQCLDGIMEKHGHKWREDYRKQFAAMVEDVKAYTPIAPVSHTTPPLHPSPGEIPDGGL